MPNHPTPNLHVAKTLVLQTFLDDWDVPFPLNQSHDLRVSALQPWTGRLAKTYHLHAVAEFCVPILKVYVYVVFLS